jgi:hypothetical protein
MSDKLLQQHVIHLTDHDAFSREQKMRMLNLVLLPGHVSSAQGRQTSVCPRAIIRTRCRADPLVLILR